MCGIFREIEREDLGVDWRIDNQEGCCLANEGSNLEHAAWLEDAGDGRQGDGFSRRRAAPIPAHDRDLAPGIAHIEAAFCAEKVDWVAPLEPAAHQLVVAACRHGAERTRRVDVAEGQAERGEVGAPQRVDENSPSHRATIPTLVEWAQQNGTGAPARSRGLSIPLPNLVTSATYIDS